MVATSSVRPDFGSTTRAARLQAAARAVQHPVVIVAAAVLHLRVRLVDARADRGRLAEVERRALDRRELAGRNQRRIDRRVAIGVDRQLVAEDVARLAGQVEVAVLRQVDGVALSVRAR